MIPPVDLLLSYAFHGKRDLRAARDALGPDGLLLIDSGAFTASRTGKPISLHAYAEFLHAWEGCWSAAVTLDVIGDHTTTAANTKALHARGLPVMPVHTVGAPLADFDAAVRDTGYVAVGGMVGTRLAAQAPYLAMLSRRAQEHGGSVHALGVGRHVLLRQTLPYSADTSTVSRGLAYNKAFLWDGRKQHQVRVGSRWAGTDLRIHRNLASDYGLDVHALCTTEAMNVEIRRSVVRAGVWGTVLMGEWIRRGRPDVPVPPGVSGLPGPRLLVALTSDESVEAALDVARATRSGKWPRIVPRLLPRHLLETA